MPSVSVNIDGTREYLARSLPEAFSGKNDPTGIGRRFRAALVFHLFDLIHEDFSAKSLHGKDRFGRVWKKLDPRTIAYRPVTEKELKALGLGGERVRGLLTPTQNKKWKGIYAGQLARLLAKGVPSDQATSLAAKSAWAILKAEGARTKIRDLSGRKLPINHRSGRLEESVTPGNLSGEHYAKASADQIVSTANPVRVGTEVPYAAYVQRVRPIIDPETVGELVRMASVRALETVKETL